MTHSASSYGAIDRIFGFYISRQFALYIVCGVVATMAQLAARYVLNDYVSFSVAVLLSYFFSMLIALVLYRRFVFETRTGGLPRQALLFVAGYLALLPVTWGLSVATEKPLLGLLPPERAHFIAHLIGVAVPVVLNYAFNKLVTFRGESGRGTLARWTGGTDTSSGWTADPSRHRAAAWALLALVCVYAGSIAIVGVSGNFPLNDDWAYANTTRDFVRTGVFTPSSWSAIPMLSEVLFASPFCMVTACGSDDLRVATLLASVVLFAATFLLVRTSTRNALVPVLAAATVAFNPVAYTLAFTFMSDMLFAALMTVGAILFIRSLERESVPREQDRSGGSRQGGPVPTKLFALSRWTDFAGGGSGLAALGTATALAATLTRQLGLCLPLAYLAVSLVQMIGAGTWRRRAVPSLVPLVVCGLALAILKQWLRIAGRLPALYDIKSSILVETLHSPIASLMRVGHNLSIIVCYMGLFALPMLLVTRASPEALPSAGAWVRRLPRLAAGAATALAIGDLAALHRLMPSGGNILTPQGVGPLLLRDTAILGLVSVPPLPQAFWLVVTLLSLLGAFLLVERLTARILVLVVGLASAQRRWHLPRQRVGELFATTAALSYVTPLLLIPFYDRYLIPLLPLTFFLVATSTLRIAPRHWRTGFALAFCLLVSIYAVLSVHDYMAWNRARWHAIADIETSKAVGADRIDGGMEYNGLHAYRPDYAVQDGKSWWWIDRDDYQVTFETIGGRDTIMRYPYETLLPPAERSIKVSRTPN